MSSFLPIHFWQEIPPNVNLRQIMPWSVCDKFNGSAAAVQDHRLIALVSSGDLIAREVKFLLHRKAQMIITTSTAAPSTNISGRMQVSSCMPWWKMIQTLLWKQVETCWPWLELKSPQRLLPSQLVLWKGWRTRSHILFLRDSCATSLPWLILSKGTM